MRALVLALIFGFAATSAASQTRQLAFIDATIVVPNLAREMRYAGAHNFVGRPIHGYEAPVCLLTRQAATALAAVQADLAASGSASKSSIAIVPRAPSPTSQPGRAISMSKRIAPNSTPTSTSRSSSHSATSPNAPAIRAARPSISL